MARRINPKCKHCATLSVEDAIALHGDDCWQPPLCHRRRSHYRHRGAINQTRKRMRRLSNKERQLSNQEGLASVGTGQLPEYLEIESPPITPTPAGVLVLYRQHKDAPVHAVAAEVWVGSHLIAGIKPVHCLGMRSPEVKEYIQDVLAILTEQFGIRRFEDTPKEISVSNCPIVPCPLK